MQALESGKLDELRGNKSAAATPANKFGIPGEGSFDAELKSIAEKNGGVSVIFLDLDNFKSVNDDHDHEVGDQVIMEAITIIETAIKVRGSSFIGRVMRCSSCFLTSMMAKRPVSASG